jgi:DNA-binding NarL/FixJ family response regulator
MKMSRTIVIVSDSHRRTREIYNFVLNTRSGDKIIEVHSRIEFFTVLKHSHPRLVFLETSYGYELTAYEIACLMTKFPHMSVAVFCNERILPSRAARFIHLGADSFVDMRLEHEAEIAQAFHSIVQGEMYVPEWVTAALEEYHLAAPDYATLQKSEMGILRLIALGNTVNDIALKLEITQGTVRNHISSIHRRLGVHRHCELIPLALKMRAVSLDELMPSDFIVAQTEG